MLNLPDREYRPLNFQPSQADRGPVCPHYPIIEICALFTGISEADLGSRKRFCGVYEEHFDTTHQLGGGSAGVTNEASATCQSVYEKFSERLEIVNTPINLPSKEEVREQAASVNFETAEKIFADYNSAKKLQTKKDEILDEWRQIVFRMSVVPTTELQDLPHFRKVEKPEDLSDEEVINYTTSFFKSLEAIVGKTKEGIFVSRSKAAQNCAQSPVSGTTTWAHSD